MQKTRRDKGIIQLTHRDKISLPWIADQYAIRLDDLAALLSQIDQKECSLEAARKLTERWIKGGYAISQKVQFKEPNWISLTRKGLNLVGSEYGLFDPSRSALLRHILMVNRVRLYLEKVYPHLEWKSERAIRKGTGFKEKMRYAPHIVDAEMILEDGDHVIGIEVELTQKDQLRLYNYLKELTAQYESVWYFVLPGVCAPLLKAMERLDHASREQVDIISLAEIGCI